MPASVPASVASMRCQHASFFASSLDSLVALLAPSIWVKLLICLLFSATTPSFWVQLLDSKSKHRDERENAVGVTW